MEDGKNIINISDNKVARLNLGPGGSVVNIFDKSGILILKYSFFSSVVSWQVVY